MIQEQDEKAGGQSVFPSVQRETRDVAALRDFQTSVETFITFLSLSMRYINILAVCMHVCN